MQRHKANAPVESEVDGDLPAAIRKWREKCEGLQKELDRLKAEDAHENVTQLYRKLDAANAEKHELERQNQRLKEANAGLATEKQRRIYYQDIVYNVCSQLDAALRLHITRGNGIVCGTVEEPSTEVQDMLTQILKMRELGIKGEQTEAAPKPQQPACCRCGLSDETVHAYEDGNFYHDTCRLSKAFKPVGQTVSHPYRLRADHSIKVEVTSDIYAAHAFRSSPLARDTSSQEARESIAMRLDIELANATSEWTAKFKAAVDTVTKATP